MKIGVVQAFVNEAAAVRERKANVEVGAERAIDFAAARRFRGYARQLSPLSAPPCEARRPPGYIPPRR